MTDFICPKCNTVIESNLKANGKLICRKCLDECGEKIIMLQETNGSQNIENIGDGFFERKK